MPEDERVSSPEETVKTEAQVEAEPAQAQPDTKEELERARQETEAYRQKYEAERKARADADRAANRLAKVRDEALGIKQAAQEQKLQIMARAQEGTLDESKGTLAQQLNQVDAEVSRRLQDVKSAAYVQDAQEAQRQVFSYIRDAGYDPLSGNLPAEVLEIQDAWGEAIRKMESLDSVVAKAKALTAKKTEPEKKEEKKDEPKKEQKALKVDTGGPSAPATPWSKMTPEEKIRLGCKTKYDH